MTDSSARNDPAVPPRLETERLMLGPLQGEDAPTIARLAGDRRIAANTLTIPHPYDEEQARAFIAMQGEEYAAGKGMALAVVRTEDDAFVGMAGLNIQPEHERAEIGYWIGVPFWGHGFATEAAQAVLDYGFRALGLHRIFGQVYRGNPPSRRVLEKIGLTYEGCQLGHIVRFGERKDVECFGLLRPDWRRIQRENAP